MVRRSAGRNDTVVGAHESVLHRDEAGRDVGDHAGNEERAKPRGVSSLGIARTFVEERFESSDTRTPNDARLLLVELLHVEPSVLHGLRGGDEGVLGEEVVLAYLLAVEILGRVVILYFTSEFRFEFLRVEVRDGGGSADTFLEIRKIFLNSIAEWVNRTYTCHHYTSCCHMKIGLIEMKRIAAKRNLWRNYFLCSSIYLIASPTVTIFSASSSGI